MCSRGGMRLQRSFREAAETESRGLSAEAACEVRVSGHAGRVKENPLRFLGSSDGRWPGTQFFPGMLHKFYPPGHSIAVSRQLRLVAAAWSQQTGVGERWRSQFLSLFGQSSC